MTASHDNVRPAPDRAMVDIADYVLAHRIRSRLAYTTARLCLLDSIGCAARAFEHPECTKLLGPVVPGAVLPGGARVPGTPFELDPVRATFDFGTLVRWLDFNDAFYGATVIHPSDTISAVLMTADWLTRRRLAAGGAPMTMRDVLTGIVKAYEIQGQLALENGFTAAGLDHSITVKIACTAVVAGMLGCDRDRIVNALSNAWIDGHPLVTFRRKPNTGWRKSWASADAASRAVWLALNAERGEMGYPSALSVPRWGFQDVLFGGRALRFQMPYGSYVIENVLFKIGYPAAFHAQSAVEAAIRLHPEVRGRLEEIDRIEVRTHESSVTILDKTGPLDNPADRDHCLQYMIAIGLIFGALRSEDYEDAVATDPRIDRLRACMRVSEDPQYTRDYHDPAKRSNANAVQVVFRDGGRTAETEVAYPLGHRRRRREGMPALLEKFRAGLARRYAPKQQAAIVEACLDQARLEAMPVDAFVGLLAG